MTFELTISHQIKLRVDRVATLMFYCWFSKSKIFDCLKLLSFHPLIFSFFVWFSPTNPLHYSSKIIIQYFSFLIAIFSNTRLVLCWQAISFPYRHPYPISMDRSRITLSSNEMLIWFNINDIIKYHSSDINFEILLNPL